MNYKIKFTTGGLGMKKIFLLMIGACLYADDEMLAESLEKQITESVVEVVDESQPIAETKPQEVLYLLGDQLVLNTGLVLEFAEHDYLELFDVGDALLFIESEEGYSVVHSLTGVEVSCSVLGQVDGKVLFVLKVMNGMVELSNGDLYLTEGDEEGFWTINTSVLKVVTQDGEMLLDVMSGSTQHVAFLGNLSA